MVISIIAWHLLKPTFHWARYRTLHSILTYGPSFHWNTEIRHGTVIAILSAPTRHFLRATMLWARYWTLHSILSYGSFHWNTDITHGTVIAILSARTRHLIRVTWLWAHGHTLITVFAKFTNGRNTKIWHHTSISFVIKTASFHWHASVWHLTAVIIISSITPHVIPITFSWTCDWTFVAIII